jgi:acetyl esterase/lipase
MTSRVSSDKTGALDQRTYVADQGYTVASIQYRTVANGHTYQDSVVDVKSAIRYLRAHADQYGINPAKVSVWGHSAGGYLAAMAGTNNDLKQFDVGGNLDQSSIVQAVVDQFGPSDLSKVAADFDTATQQTYAAPGNFLASYVFGPATRKSINDDPAAVAAANPATDVNSSDPAFLLMSGSADQIVSPSQTLLMLDALRAK